MDAVVFCFCSFSYFFFIVVLKFSVEGLERVCVLCCVVHLWISSLSLFFSFCLETLGWVRTIFSFLLPHVSCIQNWYHLLWLLFSLPRRGRFAWENEPCKTKQIDAIVFCYRFYFILWFRPGFCTLFYVYSARKRAVE